MYWWNYYWKKHRIKSSLRITVSIKIQPLFLFNYRFRVCLSTGWLGNISKMIYATFIKILSLSCSKFYNTTTIVSTLRSMLWVTSFLHDKLIVDTYISNHNSHTVTCVYQSGISPAIQWLDLGGWLSERGDVGLSSTPW